MIDFIQAGINAPWQNDKLKTVHLIWDHVIAVWAGETLLVASSNNSFLRAAFVSLKPIDPGSHHKLLLVYRIRNILYMHIHASTKVWPSVRGGNLLYKDMEGGNLGLSH